MDALKIIIIVLISLGIIKKLTKGILKIAIILGVIAYIAVKVIA